METLIVIQQMIIIFILILIGLVLHKTKVINDNTSKDISNIILKVTNPALMITSALASDERLEIKELAEATVFFVIMYIILMLLTFIIPAIIRIPKEQQYSYKMMCVFGNVGFIGIPLASAVLGNESLIYVSICNLLYSIVFYTFGISIMNKAALAAGKLPEEKASAKFKLPGWINIGTITAAITVLLYISNIHLPTMINDVLSYTGRATTFLSMIVLGVSVSNMVPKKVFANIKLYIFCIIKLVIVPVILIFIFKHFTDNQLLISTLTIMLSISFANMPLMLAKSLGINEDDISGGIILSVILSLGTIPLVSYIVSLI